MEYGFNEGEALRKFFKGGDMQMGEIAERMGMTKQNLSHHLRKTTLEANFARKVESIFKISLENDVFSKVKTNENEISRQNVSRNDQAEDDQPQAMTLEEALTMRRILQEYKRRLAEPPMSKSEGAAYYDIVSKNHPTSLFIDLMYRVDKLENEISQLK